MSSDILEDNDAIYLRTELLETTSSDAKVKRPNVRVEVAAPVLTEALAERVEKTSIITPPHEKDELKILCNKDNPIKEKESPITLLPERVIASADKLVKLQQHTIVGDTRNYRTKKK